MEIQKIFNKKILFIGFIIFLIWIILIILSITYFNFTFFLGKEITYNEIHDCIQTSQRIEQDEKNFQKIIELLKSIIDKNYISNINFLRDSNEIKDTLSPLIYNSNIDLNTKERLNNLIKNLYNNPSDFTENDLTIITGI